MWQGARELLANGILCLGGVPTPLEANAGVLIYLDQIASGQTLLKTLYSLEKLQVKAQRIRIITALACNTGLKNVGEKFPELKIYAACIDPTLTEEGEIIPGIGNPSSRLNTRIAS